MDAVQIGQLILGKYRVEGIVGQGGMGVVAECTHLVLNERVAMKMLRQDVLADRDAVERFTREAQAAVKLKSEYVADVKEAGTLENGTPYMVMEFLDGQDLGALIEERGFLPVPWATELIMQTAEALQEAHSLGIVHRDVKPSNLFVTWRPDGTALIKVLDFGISKALNATDMHLTQTQSLLGTPAYMSPEQMRSARHVDGRTDIWSLGTVLYELIEGRKPFEAESFSEMCVKVAVDPPMPMQHAPSQLATVVLRCLEKSPEQRYASMAELGRALLPFAKDRQLGKMLVERMDRMQRRWQGTDFAENTGPDGRAFAAGSEPAIGRPGRAHTPRPQTPRPHTPLPMPTAAVATSVAAELESATTLDSAQTSTTRPKSRRGILIAFVCIVLGVAGGAAFALRGDDGLNSEPAPTAGPAADLPPAASTAAAAAPPTAPSPTAGTPTPTVTPPAPTIAPFTAPATDRVVPPEPTAQTLPAKGVQPGTSKTSKTAKKPAGKLKTITRTKPDVFKAPTEIKPVKPPAADCDPFDDPHDCGGRKKTR